MSTLQQILVGGATALALATGSYFVAAKTGPTYIIEGTLSMPGPCDGGICTGQILAAISPAVLAPGAVADAAPRDATFPDATFPDATFPDAAQPDATPILTGDVGIYEPAFAGTAPSGAKLSVATLALPAPGASVCDPQFNVCERRLLASGFHEYSQLRSMSDDSTMILLYNEANTHTVYAYPSMTPIISDATNTWSAVRWRPGSHKLVYLAGSPARLMQYDVDAKVITTLATTSYPITINGNAWEQPSDDGTWWSMYVQPTSGSRIILAVNAVTGAIGAMLSLDALYSGPCVPDPQWGKLEPDFVAITPSGKYLAVQWVANQPVKKPTQPASGRCNGLELFDVQTGDYVRTLHADHPHGDWGTTAAGKEVYVTTVLAAPLNNNVSSFVVEYTDGSPATYPRYPTWGAVDHLSCRSTPGWCLISGGDPIPPTAPQPYDPGLKELYLLNMADGSEIRLGHHRSTSAKADGTFDYWSMPKATLSKDGKHITWSTTWGVNGQRIPFSIDL